MILCMRLVMRSIAKPFPSKPHLNDVGARRRRTGNSLRIIPNSRGVARDVRTNDYDPAPPSTDADVPHFTGDGGCPERPERDNGNICIPAPRKEPQHKAARLTSRDGSTERTQISTEARHLGHFGPNLVPDIGLLRQVVQKIETLYADVDTFPNEIRVRKPSPGSFTYNM